MVWLIKDTGKHAMLDRAFETANEVDAFVRRGNRTLERNGDVRALLRETTGGLLGRPKRREPKLYCLKADDIAVYETQDTETGRVIRLSYGKKPKDDTSGRTVRKRSRNERENGRIDYEAWEKLSRGI